MVIDRVRAFALPGFVFRLPGFLALGRVTDVENEGNLCGVTTVNNVKKAVGCIGGLLIAAVLLLNSQVMAAETKIGVIDMKQVLSTSTAGKRAQDLIEQKMKTLQASPGGLLARLSELEVAGRIARVPGGRFVRVER